MRLALSQMRNRADAEDVTQDVFVRLLSSTSSFDSEQHLEAWLMRTTINRCRDLHRWRSRRNTTSIDELSFEPQDHNNAAAHDRAQAAWDAVASLTDDERAIVHLVCYEERSYRETAAIIGVTEDTVRMRLYRIRKKLRDRYDEQHLESMSEPLEESEGRR